MSRRRMVAAAAITGLLVVGCGTDTDNPTPNPVSPVMSTAAPTTSSTAPSANGMDGTPLPEPTPIPGSSDEAITATAEKFVINWASYRTFAQQPQAEWFATWQEWASDEFIQQQRLQFHATWSWAWNQEKQVLGAQPVEPTKVHNFSDSTAVARVTVERHVLHIDDRVDEGDLERRTYDVQLRLGEGVPEVTDADPVDPRDPFPPARLAPA